MTLAPNYFFFQGEVRIGALAWPGFVLVNYSFAGWLAIGLLGWAFGDWFRAREEVDAAGARREAVRVLVTCGAVLLVAFALQRAVNGYGNMWLERTDGTWLRWLQVSKYPPSLAFVALELGLAALALAAFLRWDRPGRWGPLVVFGQTALFFYLVHVHLLEAARGLLARWDADFVRADAFTPPPLPLEAGWIATAAGLVVLYPPCAWWRARRERLSRPRALAPSAPAR